MSFPLYRLERVELPSRCVGSFLDPERLLIAKTLELPWKNNQSNISCIPYSDPGEAYTVIKMPPGFGREDGYFRFAFVKGRSINQFIMMSSILMHPANKPSDLLGCIGCGSRFADLDGDNIPEIVESKAKMKWMYENLPDVFHLHIAKKAS